MERDLAAQPFCRVAGFAADIVLGFILQQTYVAKSKYGVGHNGNQSREKNYLRYDWSIA
jgi:hypothetical protein